MCAPNDDGQGIHTPHSLLSHRVSFGSARSPLSRALTSPRSTAEALSVLVRSPPLVRSLVDSVGVRFARCFATRRSLGARSVPKPRRDRSSAASYQTHSARSARCVRANPRFSVSIFSAASDRCPPEHFPPRGERRAERSDSPVAGTVHAQRHAQPRTLSFSWPRRTAKSQEFLSIGAFIARSLFTFFLLLSLFLLR